MELKQTITLNSFCNLFARKRGQGWETLLWIRKFLALKNITYHHVEEEKEYKENFDSFSFY
jgi:hypothetical protein